MNKKTDIDIINDVLEQCILAYPVSSFIISIYKQYMQRGSLSKKQLQGLHVKALQVKDISAGKLATLEAVIKKMPTRYKSDLPLHKPMFEKDEQLGKIIQSILAKYPQHKRVLFLQSKYNNNDVLTPLEIAELKKFDQILNNKK